MSQNGQNVNAEEDNEFETPEIQEEQHHYQEIDRKDYREEDFDQNINDLRDIIDKLDIDLNRLKTNSQLIIRKSDIALKETQDFSVKIDKEYGTFNKIFALKELVSNLRMTIMETSGGSKIIDGEATRVAFLVEDLKRKMTRIDEQKKQ